MTETNTSPPAGPPPVAPRRGLVRRLLGWGFRTVRNLLALAMLLEIVAVFTPATERVYGWLSVDDPSPEKADYIVCLGGGHGREARSAELWHRKIAPYVIVSNAPGAAEHMRYLVTKSGVPGDRVLVDNRSYNTADHPAGIARIRGVDPAATSLVIVTDHTHTRRARACFVRGGFKHITLFAGKEHPRQGYLDSVEWRVMVIPSLIYECAGMVQYWWQGKI